MKLTTQEQDYLCSAGFVAMGAAQLIFREVYNHLKNVMDEEASLRADYKAIKATNPAYAKTLRDEMAKNYFTPDQRNRYKLMMQHIELLMRDFEWVESYAMFDHLKTKLHPSEFMNLFDALLGSSNGLARLIFLWADWQNNHPDDPDSLMLESIIKNQSKEQKVGHLAQLFNMQ